MWNNNTLWFEITIVTVVYLVGNVYFGHFEERSPRWRKMVKYIVTLGIILTLSIYFGRTVAFIVLAASIIPLIYVHGFVLPKKGINGWTGEPKGRYYDFRGWDKNIFGEKKDSNS
jgi:hypothetical protein